MLLSEQRDCLAATGRLFSQIDWNEKKKSKLGWVCPLLSSGKKCQSHTPFHQMYNDFSVPAVGLTHKERESQRGRDTQSLYRAALIALISTLTNIAYFTSTREINPACSTSTPHAQSSLVNHLPAPSLHILHNISALSSSPIFTSFLSISWDSLQTPVSMLLL